LFRVIGALALVAATSACGTLGTRGSTTGESTATSVVGPSVMDAIRLADGTPVWAGHDDGTPTLRQWTDGAWTAIGLPAELRPQVGAFSQVATDAQGSLYVGYEDKTPGAAAPAGVLARVDGTWSRLGTFDRAWTTVDALRVVSPTEVYLTTWTKAARKRAIVRWNGTAYAAIALPAGATEIVDLGLEGGALVAHFEAEGGDRTYRLAGGAWAPMGPPLKDDVNTLVNARDGSLWRLGEIVQRWTGGAWEEPLGFTMPKAYEISDACVGATDDIYVVLAVPYGSMEADNPNDNKERVAVLRGGKIQWLRGSESQARFDYSVNGLVVDASGQLHLHHSGTHVALAPGELDFLSDGYPRLDVRAAEVLALASDVAEYSRVTLRHTELFYQYRKSGSEADYQAASQAGSKALGWCAKRVEALKALAIGPKQNRLYDALLPFYENAKDRHYYQIVIADALKAGREPSSDQARLDQVNARGGGLAAEVERAMAGYAARNGLAGGFPVIRANIGPLAAIARQGAVAESSDAPDPVALQFH
jgi:hypothetical protein